MQLYDRVKRMKLMPNREKIDESRSPSPEEPEGTTTAYIILCDGCDAEFYSEEAYKVSFLIL